MTNTKRKNSTLIASSLAVFAVLAFASAPTFAEKEETFHLYGEAPTGTRLKPKIVKSPLPLDATYEQLSEAHKAKLRANYTNMPATDEPPFPVTGLEPIWEAITDINFSTDQYGEVLAIATIDPQGHVEKVSIYETTSTDMTKFVTTALAATEFKPAVCDGKPCTMDFIFEGTLNIDLMRF